MIWNVHDIVQILGSEPHHIKGELTFTFSGINSIDESNDNDFTFCSKKGEEGYNLIKKSGAKIILADLSLMGYGFSNLDKTLIFIINPRLWFIRCLESLFPIIKKTGIHPTAIIGEDCVLGKNVYVGPHSIIEDDVTIDDNTQIFSGVHIFPGVKIGKFVEINSGCVIGSDGFGFERSPNGELEKFPHFGSVIIEDNVEVGANTCIDRGTLKNTIIGSGTKIDNLVHIAHNVNIGKNCLIICLSCIAGSVKIDDNTWIAPLVAVKNGIKIGKNCIVGMGAVVIHDVPDNDVVAGVPAKSIKKSNNI